VPGLSVRNQIRNLQVYKQIMIRTCTPHKIHFTYNHNTYRLHILQNSCSDAFVIYDIDELYFFNTTFKMVGLEPPVTASNGSMRLSVTNIFACLLNCRNALSVRVGFPLLPLSLITMEVPEGSEECQVAGL